MIQNQIAGCNKGIFKKEKTMGLTQQQVQERIDQGLTNETDLSTDKTTKEIIISNTFTYFNLIFLIITVLLCLVGSFRNLTFLPIVIGNTLIGIIQEIRAKRTLDKMNLLNAPHAIVVRDGVKQKMKPNSLYRMMRSSWRRATRSAQMQSSWKEACRSMNRCLPEKRTR